MTPKVTEISSDSPAPEISPASEISPATKISKKREPSPTPLANERDPKFIKISSPSARPSTTIYTSPPTPPPYTDSEEDPADNNKAEDENSGNSNEKPEGPEEKPEGPEGKSEENDLPILEDLGDWGSSPAPHREYWENEMKKLEEQGEFFNWNPNTEVNLKKLDQKEVDDMKKEE